MSIGSGNGGGIGSNGGSAKNVPNAFFVITENQQLLNNTGDIVRATSSERNGLMTDWFTGLSIPSSTAQMLSLVNQS